MGAREPTRRDLAPQAKFLEFPQSEELQASEFRPASDHQLVMYVRVIGIQYRPSIADPKQCIEPPELPTVLFAR